MNLTTKTRIKRFSPLQRIFHVWLMLSFLTLGATGLSRMYTETPWGKWLNGLFGGYEVCIHGGRKKTGMDPVKFAIEMEKMGAGEILLTAIDRDGTQEGYNIDLIKSVTDSVGVPVIACGGAGKIEDFRAAVIDGGASACAAGSMVVYYGRNRAVLINFPYRKQLDKLFL